MDLILYFFLRSLVICGIIITVCRLNLPDPATIRLYGYAPDSGIRFCCGMAWFGYFVFCLTEPLISVLMVIVATVIIITVANIIRKRRFGLY